MMEADIEPTDEELNQIEEEDLEVKFSDHIFILENGSTLISRMMHDVEGVPDDEMLVLYKPVECIEIDLDEFYLRRWIPQAADDYIFLASARVLTVAEPDKNLHDAYVRTLSANPNDQIPENRVLH